LLKEDKEARMQAAEKLFKVGAPVADWDQMEQQIEEAHLELTKSREAP